MSGRRGLRRWIFFATACLVACGSGDDDQQNFAEPLYVSGEVDVVPRPATVLVDSNGSAFTLRDDTRILVERERPDVAAVADHLAALLRAQQLALTAVAAQRGSAQPANSILLTTRDTDPALGDEGYVLSVAERQIEIRADGAAGLFHGVQTLRQLLPAAIETAGISPPAAGWTAPSVQITDRPRFPWRGLMMDVSRAFFPVELLYRYVDLLALLKMSVLHLHLTDDQGWRIEIDSHPELHTVGSRFDSPAERSGYYTKQELRDLVAYAGERHIEVVPEVDMPGHALALLRSLPELACTTSAEEMRSAAEFPIRPWFEGPFIHEEVLCACDERIYGVLEDVLVEVIDIFPSRYVHLGGDEVPTAEWESSYLCAQALADGAIDDIAQVQAYFTKRMEDILLAHGKTLLAWDEVRSEEIAGGPDHALSPSTTIMHWRDFLPAPPGLFDRNVVQTPFTALYLDYTRRPLENVYAYEPVPAGLSAEQQAHVLGAQGNMWTGFPQGRTEERVDLHVFPKLLAIAEMTWSPRERRDFADFERRRDALTTRLDALGVARGPCDDCVF